MKRVYQILFNRPLQYEDKAIYGVRVACDEGKAKRLMDYAVEIIGQWCFTQKHGGKITEDFTKWVDVNGNTYEYRSSRQLYAYTAALATQTYFRVDEWMVDDNCDIENEVEITDPTEYFHTLCVLQEDDFKTGYNGFLQVYQKLLSRYNRLTQISSTHTGMLDYDEQEMWGAEDLCLQYILS